MNTAGISNIGRPLDTGYLTNRLIITITLLSFIAFTVNCVLNGQNSYTSLLTGARYSMTVFLLWAISSELDPDRHWGAFVVVLMSLILLSCGMDISLLPFLWFLLILRIINQSSGLPAGPFDSLLIAALGIILGYTISWIYAATSSAAFLIDSHLKEPAKYHVQAGIIMFFVSILIVIQMNSVAFETSLEGLYMFALGTVLFLPIAIKHERFASVGDRTGEVLDPSRIRATRIMSIIIFLLIALFSPGQSASLSKLIFCIFAGLGTYHILNRMIKHTGKLSGKSP
ncbi:MAG: hypothetical protein QCH31_00750 [Methanolobus sp.]|nr:hypothetical protein [Methanolobus sp.]